MKTIFALTLGCALLIGCGAPPSTTPSETPTASASATPEAAATPDKAAAEKTLTELAKSLEAGDTKTAAQYVKIPEGAPADKVDEELKKTLERKEISSAGVALLVEKGKFGPAKEIFADRAEGWAKKSGVPVEQCWAFSLDPAEAVLFWDGKGFVAIRFDDIGKLEP